MSSAAFIITIDTEGDNLWGRPRDITTRNAAFLPRFQSLCERYGFKPVYLTNYEMAMSDEFVEFGRDVAARGAGEIGMHLHAWNSPPFSPLTADDFVFQPFLIEYPEAVMREKIRVMTGLLEDRFERNIVSHRAGRWAFDGRYAAMLLAEGYRVDCSVTPCVDWRSTKGDPAGTGGPDYTKFPDAPYFLHPADISSPAADGLLEVPMTVRLGRLHRIAPWAYNVPLLRRAANRASPSPLWLCAAQPALRAPALRHLDAMLDMGRIVREQGAAHVEFMLHSSEFMPGGSPTFSTEEDIAQLYGHLERLFDELAQWCHGETLSDFHDRLKTAKAPGVALGSA